MTFKMIRTGACAAAAFAALIANPVLAQEIGAQPTFSDLTLEAGFMPDPQVIDLTAGGNIDAATIDGSECVGMIANEPDVRLTYSPDELPLHFKIEADEDTTLVINGPDGSWFCDDDSGGDANPRVSFDDPQEGVYEIWVGTYEKEPVSAKLVITEID